MDAVNWPVFGGFAAVAVIVAAFYFSPQGWRTVAVNAGLASLAVIAEMLNFLVGFDWKSVLPPEYVGWAVVLVNLLNIGLRAVTKTPMGSGGK